MFINYSEEEIFRVIHEMLRQVLRVETGRITPEARVIRDLGADSLDVLDLHFRIEKTFGFSIADGEIMESLGTGLTQEEIDSAFTVQRIVDFTARKLSTQSVPA